MERVQLFVVLYISFKELKIFTKNSNVLFRCILVILLKMKLLLIKRFKDEVNIF